MCLLSSPLNKLLLEVILPDYMQMYVVCCDVLFWPSYSTLCVRIWMLYQLSFSSDFEPHLPLSLAPLVMNYHCHSNRNMECGSNSSVFPHCSLNHNSLTSTGAIVLTRALQQNKSLEELKWVLNNTWYLYKFMCSVRYIIISTISTPPTLLTLYLCSLHALILQYSFPQSWRKWNWKFWSLCTGWCSESEPELENTEVSI